MKILVVEPHADVRYLLKEYLRRKMDSVEVVAADNPESAALLLQAKAYAGLIIDSLTREAANEVSRLGKSLQPKAFIIWFSPDPDAGYPGAAWSAVVQQPSFAELIEKIGRFAGPGRAGPGRSPGNSVKHAFMAGKPGKGAFVPKASPSGPRIVKFRYSCPARGGQSGPAG